MAATFEQDPTETIADAVAGVARQIGLSESDPECKTIEKRILPFLQDTRPGTQIQVAEKGAANRLKLGPGGRNGISSDIKQLRHGDDSGQRITQMRAQVPKGVNGVLEMKTFYAEPEGWGVISDIDDTIKVTMTSDPIGILRSTFIDQPKPCPGMPELYEYIQSLITESSPFFYLSASPYVLYPFLRDFRQQHYPVR